MLTPMRFRGFIWPNNPSRYTISFARETAVHKTPMGAYSMQDLGRTCRVMRGEGAFFGPNAYDTFRALACEFYTAGPGVLIHPVWQTASAYFTKLELMQEPCEDYVTYSFEFREGYPAEIGLTEVAAVASAASGMNSGAGADAAAVSGAAAASGGAVGSGGAAYHTVVLGDTLWDIGRAYGRTVAELVGLNPWIANPNLIYVGQEVRVQ